MIQRIQSLYLLLTTLFSVLFLNGIIIKFLTGTNEVLYLTFTGINRFSEVAGTENIEKLIPLSILLVLVPLTSFITVFLFKKRKLQLNFAVGLITIIIIKILTVFYYSNYVINEHAAELVPGFSLALPFLSLIFAFLAFRGIKKDDNLIRSYDRLR
jgi:hypothetical protein